MYCFSNFQNLTQTVFKDLENSIRVKDNLVFSAYKSCAKVT